MFLKGILESLDSYPRMYFKLKKDPSYDQKKMNVPKRDIGVLEYPRKPCRSLIDPLNEPEVSFLIN